ncbi:MAG: hypothetical protein JST82_11470 [Bacteroidetes bacterium]|nr:hypothetical protein [Bacteroidota bacterium]
MEQKVAVVNDNDIDRIIKRDFPKFIPSEIINILSLYISESNKGKNRVYASIIKLSNGDIELLKKYVDVAKNDDRDVLAQAEYPQYSEYLWAFFDSPKGQKKEDILSADWTQYQDWFNKA